MVFFLPCAKETANGRHEFYENTFVSCNTSDAWFHASPVRDHDRDGDLSTVAELELFLCKLKPMRQEILVVRWDCDDCIMNRVYQCTLSVGDAEIRRNELSIGRRGCLDMLPTSESCIRSHNFSSAMTAAFVDLG